MITQYFTFGQSHVHRINGRTFDADTVVEIIAESREQAREKMFSYFGQKWAFQYNEMPEEKYYPNGIRKEKLQ